MSAAPYRYLSERHLKAIGLMVVEVSRLELFLVDFAALFMGVDAVTAIITIGPQKFSNKIKTIKTFVNWRFKDEKDKEDGISILDAASDICESRNSIVHATWPIDNDDVPSAVRFSSHGEFKRNRSITTPDDIEAIADDAIHLQGEIERFLERIRAQS
jgi:hypothetical protein